MPTAWHDEAMMVGGGGFAGTIPAGAGNVPACPTDGAVPLVAAMRPFSSEPAPRRACVRDG